MDPNPTPSTDPQVPGTPAQDGGESPVGDQAPPAPAAEGTPTPPVDTRTIEEKIREALAGGAGLEVLTQLKSLIDTETNKLRAEEREKTETVRRQRRAELVGRINEMVDLGSLLTPFLAEAKECGLLGLVISFAGDVLSVTPQAQAAAVPKAATSKEPRVAPDGVTPVRAPAGQSPEPGDEATWLAVTSEADRAFDLRAIEDEVAAAEARGRTGKSVRNSITWRVRHDRIKAARTGTLVGHLKAPEAAA